MFIDTTIPVIITVVRSKSGNILEGLLCQENSFTQVMVGILGIADMQNMHKAVRPYHVRSLLVIRVNHVQAICHLDQ